MTDTIKVPGIKGPLPKWGVYAGVGGVAVLAIVHFRNQKSAASSAAGQNTTGLASGGLLSGDTSQAYPWDGTYGNPSDPYSLDNTTGQTYGNAGYYGGYGVQGTPGGTGQLSGPPFSSNAAWSAYVLQQDAGVHPNMALALGLYLDGQALSANEQDLIYQAQAMAGQVPVSGAGGYPPKLRATAAKGTGHKGGTKFAHNPVSGLRAHVVAQNHPAAKGRPSPPHQVDIEISWDKSADATGYQVSVDNVSGHRTALSPVTTTHTSYTVRGLSNGTFRVKVLAKPAEKGAHAATTEVKG